MRARERMKRWWLLCLAVAVLSNGAVAQRVSRETARSVAETFFNSNVREDQAVHFTDITAETTFQNFYIFSADSGFVIVAADERVLPILGYSKKNPFVVEDMPVNLRWWLEGYDAKIQTVRENAIPATNEISEEWRNLIEGAVINGNRSTVGPLLTTEWGQCSRYPEAWSTYNYYCPQTPHPATLRCPTGCVATAMAQIMNYWEHPVRGVSHHCYIPHTHPEYGQQCAYFDIEDYDWENMPDVVNVINPIEEIMAVAKLMYHCGVAVDMDYAPGESGAQFIPTISAFKTYFKYSEMARGESKDWYSDEQWRNLLKAELNHGRPVYYTGDYYNYDGTAGSHAFVCDGYDDNNQFHFNWGWRGDNNGYFVIGSLNPGAGGTGSGEGTYNDKNHIIVGLEPVSDDLAKPMINMVETSSNTRTVRVTWNTVVGASYYRLYRDGKVVSSYTIGNTFTDINVPYGEHTYRVVAVDGNGFVSVASDVCNGNIAGPTPKPIGLACSITGNNVELSWNAPSNGEDYIAHHPQSVSGGDIQSMGTEDFDWLERFMHSEMNAHYNKHIDKIGVYVQNINVVHDLTIYRGDFSYRLMGYSEIAHYQFVPSESGWYYLTLANTIPIPSNEDIWIEMKTQESTNSASYAWVGGELPVSFVNMKFGNYRCLYSLSEGLHWLIDLHVSYAHDFTYNVYRNDIQNPNPVCIAENVEDLYYVDNDVPYGNYVYYVTTNYFNGESAQSNIQNVDFTENFTIVATSSPLAGGNISGNQSSYLLGGTVTLTASANPGYVFNGWMESGQVVCSSPTYTFQALSNRNLTASFTSSQFTIGSLITNPDGSQGIVFHLNQDGAEGWMVALNDASEGCQWGEATDLLSLQEVPYNDLTALSDLSGYRNTNILRTLQGEESGYAAAQVDYANGWYLPSVGQLRKLYSALPFIDSALIAAGGSTLTEDTYWSSTEYSASDASTPMFSMGNTNKTSNCRVRAIRNFVKAGNNAVIVACNDNNRGTASVSGTGLFTFGDLVTVTATPNEGFVLDHWSEDGVVVSYDTEYQFTFTHSRSLVANFVVPGSLGNIVNNVDGSRGVVFWRSPDCDESLIVALEDISVGCQWGEATDVPTLVNKPCNSPLAMQDVSGNTNTRCIRDYQGTDNDYAASLVDFDDGWYLPAAGELCRLYSALPLIKTALVDAGGSLLLDGAYWSSTEHSGSGAVIVNSGNMGSANKTGTCRVRAIQHIAAAGPNAIAVKPNNLDYGTVTGTGEYVYSQNVIVTATANEGYTFESWTENGMIVSYDATYQFPFTRSRSLVANFVISGSIGNVVCNADGSKGVVFWVSPDGDEGLMVALEDASAGCQWGEATDALTLVNKPYNNVMALEDVSGNTNTRCIRNHQGIANNYAASLVDFENGWYLPSVGELRKLYGALPMIETALVNAGGSTLTEDTYWSSTEYSGSDAATATFSMGNTNKTDTCRVRAIRHFAVAGPNAITVKPNNLDFGFVTGSGDYAYGQSVTVTATANEGYTFETWTENGMIVSYDATYQFLFTRSRSLVANFVVSGSIGSVVCNADGSQGVVFWLSPDGDEGLMVALEDASVGCQWGEATDALTLLNIPYNQMALQDVSGNTNTRCIRKHQGINNDYAASLVDFEDGWYLPAAGELRRLYDTLQMIEASIVNAGGSLPLNNTYWSSTEKSGSIAYTINSGSMGSTNKTSTCRVRAIRHFATAGPNAITVKSNNLGYGTVTGSGEYSYGQDVTVTAIPNSGYTFNAWTENGMIVSYDATYQFPFTRSRSLVANFVIPNSIGSIVTNTDGSRGVVFFTYPSGIGGLVVALEDVSEGCPWGLNEDITIMENQSPSAVMNLMNDMCGKSNTNKIREWYSGNTKYAACKTDFANGWYLPSAGQLRKLYAALPMIESVVVNACGTMMTEDNYWSSTEQSASDAWTPMFAMNSTNKTSNCRVRAIRSLTNLETITTDVNIAAGGTVTGAGRYDYGQTCTLKATPSPTYAFLCWKRNGVTVSTDMEYSFTVLGSYTYVAHFVANSCNITTAMDPVVGGIVTGAGAYAIGTNCTLTATPHTGYTFTNWTKNGNEVSTQSTYSFTVTESGQYTAHFALNSYEIIATVFPEEGGAVSGAHAYTHGSTAILTALPTEGYTFINWKENGVVVSTSPTYQFVVTGNRTLQANFSNNAYTITAIAYPSDGGTIEGAGVYEYGTVATLTAHANNGYEFFCWFENDDMVSFEPTISFEVAEDVVIYVVFVENENITQTTNLAQGWNWFSTYLDISLDDLKTALVDALGSSTITINSQNNGSTTYNGTIWRGTLNTLDVTQMYKVKVTGDCEVVLAGTMLNAAEHPVIIHNGANWIGFPLNVSMSLSNAFAGFAVSGDIIRSKDSSSTYNGTMWRGPLNTLVPGQGYIYKSSAAGDRTFSFPASTGKSNQ